MDAVIILAGFIVFIVAAVLLRREPDATERALRDLRSARSKSELIENADRTRNVPPPP